VVPYSWRSGGPLVVAGDSLPTPIFINFTVRCCEGQLNSTKDKPIDSAKSKRMRQVVILNRWLTASRN
jgi:hypothetical protein